MLSLFEHINKFVLYFCLYNLRQVFEEMVLESSCEGRVILEEHDGGFKVMAYLLGQM